MNAPAHHQYAPAASIASYRTELHCGNVTLSVRQQPKIARVAIGKEKDRKPIDPPPVVKFDVSPKVDSCRNYLQSPFFFMTCTLLAPSSINTTLANLGNLGTALAGTLVSSLHRLKDGKENNNIDEAFFVFADLSVKLEGKFRLQFSLFEMSEGHCTFIQSVLSESFQVYSHKSWPGMNESTFLTRTFSDQGVRLRLRKEPRTLLKKRGPASDDYEPRKCRKSQPNPQQEKESLKESDTQQPSKHSPPERDHLINPTFTPDGNGQQSDYNDSQFKDPPAKRPRTGSSHSQIPSFDRSTSFPNTPLGGPSMYTEQLQQDFNFGQSTYQQSQAGYFNGFNDIVQSAQLGSPNRDYFSSVQGRTGSISSCDLNPERSPVMLHSQQNSSLYSQAQAQYGVGSQGSQTQASSLQQRHGFIPDGYNAFGYQIRQSSIDLPGLMAPPIIGRMNSSNFDGGFGHSQNAMRAGYRPNIGQSQHQNLSASSMGGIFSVNRAPASMGAAGVSSLDSATF